eukprot:jgi/Astpho2/6082/fgenesh1_pg.00084_%23_67_t
MAAVYGLAVLGLLGPSWWFMGKGAQHVKAPLITGYLLAGVLSGPSVMGLLTVPALSSVKFMDGLCLSIIALAAGAELRISELRRTQRQVLSITTGLSICSFMAVFFTVLLLSPLLPMAKGLSAAQLEVLAALAGVLAIARSPASAIAVLKETEGRGPFCSLVMAVVVVKDVVTFICFAINLEAASVVMRKEPSGGRASHLLVPLATLVSSGLLGTVSGVLLGLQVGGSASGRRWPAAVKRLPSPAQKWVQPAVVLLCTAAIFFLAEAIHAEPLLTCVVAGAVTTNRRAEASSSLIQEELAASLSQLMPLVYLLFFGLTGASLKLASFVGSLWAAAVIFGARLGAIYLGSWLGCWLGAAPSDARKHLWMGMVTQASHAGVAMGLAKTTAAKFPGDWAADFTTLMVCVITLNLLAGPLLFKRAVILTGEARATHLLPHDRKDGDM